MKLDKFFKLKNDLETFSFEKNFNSLSTTLYYFSFLGNIFLVLFSYFFIKNVTDSIPPLFPGQGLFFSIFIILFMTGYELFKRFAFEQLTFSIFRNKLITFNNVIGFLVCGSLVAGSFYLSLNGAHRLIDTSETISVKADLTLSNKTDSIAKYYDKEIQFYRSQPAVRKSDRLYRDSIVNVLSTQKEEKIKSLESKISSKTEGQATTLKENNTAFALMVVFLELIILIGVAFSSYYIWTSYDEMKELLTTPKFRQMEVNLRLLKLYYQNGRKKEQDSALPKTKLVALASTSKIPCNQTDINNFIVLCSELEIITGNRRKKTYNMSYEKAKALLENQEL
jgi:hypothetical protein